MAGVSGGFCTGTADGVEYDHRGHEGRQLRIAGHRELVGVGVEQEVDDVAAGRVGCLLDELPRGVVDPGGAHARRLGPLTRVGEDDREILPSSSRSPEGQGDPNDQTLQACRVFHYRRVTSTGRQRGAGFRDCRAGASCRGRPRGGGSRPRAHQDRSDDAKERETPRSGAGGHLGEATLPPRHRHAAWVAHPPGWWNWQTRRTQNPLLLERAGSSPAPGTQ